MDLITTAGMIQLLRAERRGRMDAVPNHLFEAPAVPLRPRRKRRWLGLF
jgi:hypothetical protein